MNKFSLKLARFMYGRYGIDETYYLLLAVWFLLFLLGVIFNGTAKIVLNVASLLVFAFSVYRVMSKKHDKRRRENAWLKKLCTKCREASYLRKCKKRDKDTHVYVKCKNCHAVLRLPRVPGEHGVVCPKCKNRFKTVVK